MRADVSSCLLSFRLGSELAGLACKRGGYGAFEGGQVLAKLQGAVAEQVYGGVGTAVHLHNGFGDEVKRLGGQAVLALVALKQCGAGNVLLAVVRLQQELAQSGYAKQAKVKAVCCSWVHAYGSVAYAGKALRYELVGVYACEGVDVAGAGGVHGAQSVGEAAAYFCAKVGVRELQQRVQGVGWLGQYDG